MFNFQKLDPQPPKPGEHKFTNPPYKAFYNDYHKKWWVTPTDVSQYDPSPYELYEYDSPVENGYVIEIASEWVWAHGMYDLHRTTQTSQRCLLHRKTLVEIKEFLLENCTVPSVNEALTYGECEVTFGLTTELWLILKSR